MKEAKKRGGVRRGKNSQEGREHTKRYTQGGLIYKSFLEKKKRTRSRQTPGVSGLGVRPGLGRVSLWRGGMWERTTTSTKGLVKKKKTAKTGQKNKGETDRKYRKGNAGKRRTHKGLRGQIR